MASSWDPFWVGAMNCLLTQPRARAPLPPIHAVTEPRCCRSALCARLALAFEAMRLSRAERAPTRASAELRSGQAMAWDAATRSLASRNSRRMTSEQGPDMARARHPDQAGAISLGQRLRSRQSARPRRQLGGHDQYRGTSVGFYRQRPPAPHSSPRPIHRASAGTHTGKPHRPHRASTARVPASDASLPHGNHLGTRLAHRQHRMPGCRRHRIHQHQRRRPHRRRTRPSASKPAQARPRQHISLPAQRTPAPAPRNPRTASPRSRPPAGCSSSASYLASKSLRLEHPPPHIPLPRTAAGPVDHQYLVRHPPILGANPHPPDAVVGARSARDGHRACRNAYRAQSALLRGPADLGVFLSLRALLLRCTVTTP